MRARDAQRLGDVLTDRTRTALAEHGEWYGRLCELAAIGFTSSTGGGRSSDVSDPTFRVATTDDPVRTIKKQHDADLVALDALVARIERRRLWVIAKGLPHHRPGPVVCENAPCGEPISGRGSDVQRGGLCPRCYQHQRRHGLAWPKRYLTPDEAARVTP